MLDVILTEIVFREKTILFFESIWNRIAYMVLLHPDKIDNAYCITYSPKRDKAGTPQDKRNGVSLRIDNKCRIEK